MPLLVSPLINLNPKITLYFRNFGMFIAQSATVYLCCNNSFVIINIGNIFFNRFKNENKFKVRKWKRIKIDFFFLSAVLTRVKIN